MLVLQNFTTARKSGKIVLTYLKAFFIWHTSEYETSVGIYSLTKIYADEVTCDTMYLVGPKSDQLGPINHRLLEESYSDVSYFDEYRTNKCF